MGLTWLFGFLASFLKMSVLWYPFIILNGLQGTFIFIIFDLKWKVYFTAYEKIIGKVHPRKSQHLKKTFMKWMSQSSTPSNKDSKPAREEQRFKNKADLLVKILKWTKQKHSHSSERLEIHDKNQKPPAKHNAWHQLKELISIKEIKEHDEERSAIESSAPKTKAPLKRQTKVDIEMPMMDSNDDSLHAVLPPVSRTPPPYQPPPPYRLGWAFSNEKKIFLLKYFENLSIYSLQILQIFTSIKRRVSSLTKTTIIQHHTITDSGDGGDWSREQECVQLWRFYVSNSHCQDNPAPAIEIGGKVIILFD